MKKCPQVEILELKDKVEGRDVEIAQLQTKLNIAELVMRNHDCHDVWSDAIKELNDEY